MQIDNYGKAIALKNRLEAAVPFRVRPAKQLLKAMKDEDISTETWLDVDSVTYFGDEGGILLSLVATELKTSYSVSLTHVVFDPEHELAADVQAYQKERSRRLKLQHQAGFAAELLAQKPPSSRKVKRKGFGK